MINEFWHIFTAHAQKRLFRSFRSKIWPGHSLQRPRFPIVQMYFHYRVTFTEYIWCSCATTSCDLVTLTFEILIVSYTVPPMPDPHTNFDYSTIIGYWVMNYWIWSHFRYQKQSLRMRSTCITWPEHMVSPKTTRNIFDAELSIPYTTFMVLGRRLWVVYIGAK